MARLRARTQILRHSPGEPGEPAARPLVWPARAALRQDVPLSWRRTAGGCATGPPARLDCSMERTSDFLLSAAAALAALAAPRRPGEVSRAARARPGGASPRWTQLSLRPVAPDNRPEHGRARAVTSGSTTEPLAGRPAARSGRKVGLSHTQARPAPRTRFVDWTSAARARQLPLAHCRSTREREMRPSGGRSVPPQWAASDVAPTSSAHQKAAPRRKCQLALR